jgi:hypothetical protein
MYGVYTVFLAEKSLNIWSYTMHLYGSGQPYVYVYICIHTCFEWKCCVQLYIFLGLTHVHRALLVSNSVICADAASPLQQSRFTLFVHIEPFACISLCVESFVCISLSISLCPRLPYFLWRAFCTNCAPTQGCPY